MTKLSVIYYSATGPGAAVARTVADAGQAAGAEVRLRQVAELAERSAIEADPPRWPTTKPPCTFRGQLPKTSCGQTA